MPINFVFLIDQGTQGPCELSVPRHGMYTCVHEGSRLEPPTTAQIQARVDSPSI